MAGSFPKADRPGAYLLTQNRWNMLSDMFRWWCENKSTLASVTKTQASRGQEWKPYVTLWNDRDRLYEVGCVVAVDRPLCSKQEDESHFLFDQGYYVRPPTALSDAAKLAILYQPLNPGSSADPTSARGVVSGDVPALLLIPQSFLDEPSYDWDCSAEPVFSGDNECKLTIARGGPVTVLWPSLDDVRSGRVPFELDDEGNPTNCICAKVRLSGGSSLPGTTKVLDEVRLSKDCLAIECATKEVYAPAPPDPPTCDSEEQTVEDFSLLTTTGQLGPPDPSGPDASVEDGMITELGENPCTCWTLTGTADITSGAPSIEITINGQKLTLTESGPFELEFTVDSSFIEYAFDSEFEGSSNVDFTEVKVTPTVERTDFETCLQFQTREVIDDIRLGKNGTSIECLKSTVYVPKSEKVDWEECLDLTGLGNSQALQDQIDDLKKCVCLLKDYVLEREPPTEEEQAEFDECCDCSVPCPSCALPSTVTTQIDLFDRQPSPASAMIYAANVAGFPVALQLFLADCERLISEALESGIEVTQQEEGGCEWRGSMTISCDSAAVSNPASQQPQGWDVEADVEIVGGFTATEAGIQGGFSFNRAVVTAGPTFLVGQTFVQQQGLSTGGRLASVAFGADLNNPILCQPAIDGEFQDFNHAGSIFDFPGHQMRVRFV